MGSSSKKYKEKEPTSSSSSSRKRRHHSETEDVVETPREKRHRHHKRHHKDRRRDKTQRPNDPDYESGDSDVVEVVPDETPTKRESIPEQSGGGSTESLSIEETNKLRAKLGLKPLSQSSTSADGKKKDDLGEFYHKPAENLASKAQQEKMRKKLQEHKEKRQVDGKLAKVKPLGESDSDDDVVAWVDRNRSIEMAKKEAAKRAKMLEELDEQFGIGEVVESEQRAKRMRQYTEKNLKGLRVDHDLDNFDEGKTVVLTLKDQGVLDEDDDVLVNVNMLDDERYKKSVENKKKKIQYNAYDTEEVDEFGNLKRKDILAKYDEEIDGEKRDGFKIGEQPKENKTLIAEIIKQKLERRRLEVLNDTTLTLASDYYNEEELSKFKKPKKKPKKIRSKGKILTADDLEQNTSNEGIEEIGTRRPKIKEDDLIIDDIPAIDIPTDIKLEEKDDELERALHKARKAKQKEAALSDFLASVPIKSETEDNLDGGSIVLNSTAEFCRTLGDIPTYGKSGNREEIEEDMLDFEKTKAAAEDMEVEEVEVEEDDRAGRWSSVDPNYKPEVPEVVDTEVPILDEEPDVSAGVGAALKLAMSKGYLEKEENKRPSNSRLAHLQAKHYSIEDKSYGDEGERGNRRERYSGPIMEFKDKDGFKPNVKLEYIDDEGHVLNSKEAFRYLSHKFHGKGPGKNKVEKRIKKNVQEGLMKKMSSTDTPLGTLNMLQAKQKEMQTPYIVLSGSKHTHSTVISKSRR